jgi:ATP-dependent RNA helicase DDX47/RRP3
MSIAEIPETAVQNDLLVDEIENVTFESLGLAPELCLACRDAGWTNPTRIQVAAVPPAAIEGRDIVGIAQTGSGKTGAYCLPMLHWLLSQPSVPYLSALVLVPTRELALQVSEQCVMLGKSVGLRCATLVGGVDAVAQACELSKRPHVIVGTPGRVKDHLANTKGFKLVKLHWLVLDEADKMLDMDYQREIDAILQQLPRERQTMLFSATLSTKFDRLQKASLKDPVVLQVHRKNSTADNLKQFFIFVPFAQMLTYLHVFLTRENGNHILIFCASQQLVHRITLTLRILGHRALPLMGRMTQENRNAALRKFKEDKCRILVCTDLAQRGLDIASTDVVVNYSLPLAAKDYIHRVGRTARAGAHGKAVNIVSQYDVLQLKNIEGTTGVTMEEIAMRDADIADVAQRVEDAELEAGREVREQEQDEKLSGEQRTVAAPRVAKRVRVGDRDAGYDDSKRNESNFGAMRMRRENEEVFDMTKKKQHKSLHQLRREEKKKSK